MNFEEHAAKPLIAGFGIPVPASSLADTPAAAARAAAEIGPSVIKAQVPTGKRGKAGGIKIAATPEEAEAQARDILGMTIDGWPVHAVLVEAQSDIKREYYAAVLIDHGAEAPTILFSTLGGMDVEEAAAQDPTAMRRIPCPLSGPVTEAMIADGLAGLDLDGLEADCASVLLKMYQAFSACDAELLEINPLVVTKDRQVVALDCKLTIDDAAAFRQGEIVAQAAPEKLTALERKAKDAGLKYIELGGAVGVLANGAGLTMTTMDVIAHYGGTPANFLEIGGEAYTKSHTALSILLENKNIKSLLVNFCGAFARTDVMAEGVVAAWEDLKPDIPVFFTIHGTGEEEAVALVKKRLGIQPYDVMDDAVKAAVAAAGQGA